MPSTRSNLEPAIIENLSTNEKVYCMFNPNEYTVTKQNQWDAGDTKGTNVPKIKFKSGGAEQLKLVLFFDTYGDGTDVREHTQGLWGMMMVSEEKKNPRNSKSEPPQVEFRWGKFSFQAVIMSLSQKFTLFDKEGVPLRTSVDVTFQQVADEKNHKKQNPTSGGGPPMKTYIVQAGERLDLIAARVYGDPSYWRLIAAQNHIYHPLHIQEGQQLVIPPLE